jgi:hypothetical protein
MALTIPVPRGCRYLRYAGPVKRHRDIFTNTRSPFPFQIVHGVHEHISPSIIIITLTMAQVQEPKEEEVIKKLVERVERQLKEGISVAWLESDSDILFDTYQANPSGQQSSTSASGAAPSAGSSLQTYFENEVALKTRQALIELSANQINVVVDYLATLLDKLVKVKSNHPTKS